MAAPKRTANTMSDAIALSSPSGRMSKRARKEAEKRLAQALFGDGTCFAPQPPKIDKKADLLRRAKELRALADRGMCAKKYRKEAKKLEDEAACL